MWLIGMEVIYYDITNETKDLESLKMISDKCKNEGLFEIEEIRLENTEYIVCIICKYYKYIGTISIDYILLITS